MKALEILNAVIYEGCMPQCGTMVNDGTFTLRDYFGAVNHKGTMTRGTYFYVYADDYADVLGKMPPADLMLETEDAGNVWLWLVDE